MADKLKPIGVDADGYDILTTAMKALLNQYPGLQENETIRFEQLEDDSGIAFSNDNGALVYSEKEDVCGVMLRSASILFSSYTGRHHCERNRRSTYRHS